MLDKALLIFLIRETQPYQYWRFFLHPHLSPADTWAVLVAELAVRPNQPTHSTRCGRCNVMARSTITFQVTPAGNYRSWDQVIVSTSDQISTFLELEPDCQWFRVRCPSSLFKIRSGGRNWPLTARRYLGSCQTRANPCLVPALNFSGMAHFHMNHLQVDRWSMPEGIAGH